MKMSIRAFVFAVSLLVSSFVHAYPPEIPENFKEFSMVITCQSKEPTNISLTIYVTKEHEVVSIFSRNDEEIFLVFISVARDGGVIHGYINISGAWKEISALDLQSATREEIEVNIEMLEEIRSRFPTDAEFAMLHQCANVR